MSGPLNRVGGHPLHRQIADELRGDILAGRLAPGARLQSERDLEERFQVQRDSIRRALALLRGEGWLDTQHGRGTFVRDQPPAASIELLLEVDADQRGVFMYRHAEDWQLLRPTTITREPARPDVAHRLDIDHNTTVVVRDRIIGPIGGPTRQLATSYIPGHLVDRFPRLAEPNTGPTGFLGLLEDAGYRLRFTVTVASRMPLPAEATALQLGPGQPVLRLLRTSYDTAADQPVELTDYRLDASRYEVSVPLHDRRGPLAGGPDPGPRPEPPGANALGVVEPAHEADLED